MSRILASFALAELGIAVALIVFTIAAAGQHRPHLRRRLERRARYAAATGTVIYVLAGTSVMFPGLAVAGGLGIGVLSARSALHDDDRAQRLAVTVNRRH